MKHHLRYFLLFTWLSFLFSCELEPCKDYPCVNGQPLENGNSCYCLCRYGWSGVDCTVEDKCATQNIICRNGGFCNKNTGRCNCVAGYEGDSCQILSRDKFLNDSESGLWDAKDTCGTNFYQYVIEMKKASDNKALEVYNIRNMSSSQFILADVNLNKFNQRTPVLISGTEVHELEGNLSQDRTQISVTYRTVQASSLNCRGKWDRQ